MFSMKIFNLIFLFLIITLLMSCTASQKVNTIKYVKISCIYLEIISELELYNSKTIPDNIKIKPTKNCEAPEMDFMLKVFKYFLFVLM